METQKLIESIVNQWIESTECFLVDVKVTPGRIVVFIDKPTGVTLDECARLNRHLVEVLEPGQLLETHELEVSSPGMDQPLKVFQQYQRRIGKEVRVVTTDGLEHKGTLESADSNGINLLERISRKENNKKVTSEIKRHLDYTSIKETKLILSFKN